jgi:hypothetical protein
MTTLPPPPLPPVIRDQRKIDSDHLKLLSIFHYVVAGFSLLGLGFLFLHWLFMHSMFTNPAMWQNSEQPPPPPEFFALFKWIYVFLGTMIILGGVGNVMSGLFIRGHKARVFSLVVAGINCLFFPIGTILGVFTLIVLLRPSVVELYAADAGKAAA